MIDLLFAGLTLLAILGSGTVGGVFFAFSTFVMGALARLPSAQGIAAMQSINLVVINPKFLGVFMGTAVLSVVLGIASFVMWQEDGAAFLLAGSLFYFVGSFLVTALFNVPRNNALMAVSPESGREFWLDFLDGWTMWNHVRTAASLLACFTFSFALYYQAAGN